MIKLLGWKFSLGFQLKSCTPEGSLQTEAAVASGINLDTSNTQAEFNCIVQLPN